MVCNHVLITLPCVAEFDMEVLVHNGQFYEAKLPVQHCPSNSGCRSIVKQANGDSYFQLTENFIFTLKVGWSMCEKFA